MIPKTAYHSLILFLLSFCTLSAQKPQKLSSGEIYEQVQKLNFLGSVLYVAAHPDDENTKLISYFSNEVKARTAYLSLTRGDGGQNLIGSELRELLGVLRTQELLAARRIDGGEQLFSRANDFGFSKEPNETFSIWDKNQVLSDVVLAIRKFQPDIIINRFDHRSPGTTHGHHTASAMLSMEAFDLAGNKNSFPEQLSSLKTWQPKRIFFNTSWWFYGSEEKFEQADKSKMATINAGVYFGIKGKSNGEIAALSRSQHKCQGFGTIGTRGDEMEYLEFLKGDFAKDKNNLFEGINTTWSRVKGGEAIGKILNEIEAHFNFKDPSVHIPKLIEAYQLVSKLEDEHWRAIKKQELENIILASAGLFFEGVSSEQSTNPDSDFTLKLEAVNQGGQDIELINVTFLNNPENGIILGKKLDKNKPFKTEKRLHTLASTPYTSPYWLNEKGTLGMYTVKDMAMIGRPDSEKLKLKWSLKIAGQPLDIYREIVYKISDPEKGEIYQPFEVLPEATATVIDDVTIFSDSKTKPISVKVKSGKTNLKGTISLQVPQGWNVSPDKIDFDIVMKNDEKIVVFNVTPPSYENKGIIAPVITVDGQKYTQKLTTIQYDHIPKQSVLMPSEASVVRLNIKRSGQLIGYIEGAGDEIPQSLKQIGYDVRIIKPSEITETTLSGFDAIVMGIRAYNVITDLQFKQRYLLDYVKNGGTMVVQYNTSGRRGFNGFNVPDFSPYELNISSDRVTDENAKVSFLNATHSVLNHPNKITETDFQGWVQERGLYFPDKWASEFTPILGMKDLGETEKQGSLLVANYGKGYYIYTGLSFFRELPAGVPGAFKLFTNLISIGKKDKS
ncbi:LmbE family N-acetylglucosaminyl deacetylase [Flavobacterium sp. 28YEA47A]|uniref:PIG-L family deacetylase n=1 Tax=Flavobacterium sp. 28YEA47A TaxID=3156276 RepID=UPI003514794C